MDITSTCLAHNVNVIKYGSTYVIVGIAMALGFFAFLTTTLQQAVAEKTNFNALVLL